LARTTFRIVDVLIPKAADRLHVGMRHRDSGRIRQPEPLFQVVRLETAMYTTSLPL
jgi:hypothetical protein